MPTAIRGPVAGVSLRQHFPSSSEVDCIAVDAATRNQGVGRTLHARAEDWLVSQGARLLQVKTLAESHPSVGYAETRQFYAGIGYHPLEVFATLWAAELPLVKALGNTGASQHTPD